MRRTCASLALVLLLSALACAQTARFVLSGVSDTGVPIDDLARSDLEVRLGTRAVPVAAVTRYHDAPVRIMVVLDQSESMQDRWHVAVAIVFELLRTAPPNAQVALVSGTDAPGEVITRRQTIARYLANSLKPHHGPGGQTRLWDDMHLALTALGEPRGGDVIFVLSDGADNASKIPFLPLAAEIRAAHVRVSSALLLPPFETAIEQDENAGRLADLVRSTGGYNLTGPPFTRSDDSVDAVRVEARTMVESLPGFFRTFYDFYVVDLAGEPAAAGEKVSVRATRKERVVLAAPEQATAAP
jgi:hypothetical protein